MTTLTLALQSDQAGWKALPVHLTLTAPFASAGKDRQLDA